MKTYILMLGIFLVSVIGVLAQKPIVVIDDSVNFSKGVYPGLILNIPEAPYDLIQKEWMETIGDNTKSEVVNENGEMSLFGANIKEISKTPVNIFSRIRNFDTVIQICAIFELKKDVYIERATGEDILNKTKNFLKDFGKEQYIVVAKKQLAEEEKTLKDMERELESLQSNKLKLQKEILSEKRTIQEKKDAQAIDNNELATLSAEIIEQNNQLNVMDPGTTRDEKEKYIRTLEKRKKDAMKDIESAENKINKANSEIEDANVEIQKNDALQEASRIKIAKQEALVKFHTDKLNRIKKY